MKIEKCVYCASTDLWEGLWAMRNFRLFPRGFGRGLGGVLAEFTICMTCSYTHVHFGEKEMKKIKHWRKQEADESVLKVNRR